MSEVHEILVRARWRLLEGGWRQGDWGSGSDGPYCVLGCVSQAARDLVGRYDSPLTGRAKAHVAEAVGIDPSRYGALMFWNDRPARTFDEVIAALDDAILASAPKDTPAPQPETPSPSVPRVFA